MSLTRSTSEARIRFHRNINIFRRIRRGRPAQGAATPEPSRVSPMSKKVQHQESSSSAEPRDSIAYMTVMRHPEGWALMVEDIEEPAWVLSTKKKAVKAAREAAEELGTLLRVLTSKGKLQREISYA